MESQKESDKLEFKEFNILNNCVLCELTRKENIRRTNNHKTLGETKNFFLDINRTRLSAQLILQSIIVTARRQFKGDEFADETSVALVVRTDSMVRSM
ncbi:MAG: hypothetical protein M0T73_16420 [Deltaproteobacteria bacterium]|nr:hypothetical protein [Deltaproteobacteria bacterium]